MACVQVEQLAVALERLTGAVEGANMCDNCVVYDVLVPCMEPMLVVQRAFRYHELITRILFALAAAMAREHSGELRREGGCLALRCGAAVPPCLSLTASTDACDIELHTRTVDCTCLYCTGELRGARKGNWTLIGCAGASEVGGGADQQLLRASTQ